MHFPDVRVQKGARPMGERHRRGGGGNIRGIDNDNRAVYDPHTARISVCLAVEGKFPSCDANKDNRVVCNPHATLVSLCLHL